MDSYNLIGYRKIYKSKKVSELFLGTFTIQWRYLRVNYTAICTEAIPLSFFEKMVCGIISIEERVSLKGLALIMGLNIENDIDNMKFQDPGETEILMETLRNLKYYGMISTPDDVYSYVELTPIGREYYNQGRKFKEGEVKGFTMYYDLMTSDHNKAKSLYCMVSPDGALTSDASDTDYGNESYVKQFAEMQVPQIYSSETGNSFTGMTVKSKDFLFKNIVFAVIYDSITETYRLEVVDNGGIDESYLNNTVNSEQTITHFISQFANNQCLSSDSKSDSQLEYEDKIIQIQRDVDYSFFNEKPQEALKKVEEFSLSPMYMETENLYEFIKKKYGLGNITTIFINLPNISEEDEKELKSIAALNNLKIMLSCTSLEDFDNRFGDNVLVVNGDCNSEPELVLDDISYVNNKLVFNAGNSTFSVNFWARQEGMPDKQLEDLCNSFAAKYVPNDISKFEEVLSNTDTTDIVNRINELKNAEMLLHFDNAHVVATGYMSQLESLRARRDEMIIELVQEYSRQLIEEVEKLKVNTDTDSINNLTDMEKSKGYLQAIKEKFIPEQSKDNELLKDNGFVQALWNTTESFGQVLNEREKVLRQELLPKSYVLDTNIFVLFPKIMDYISRDDRIILSGKVLDELDKLKSKTVGKDKKNVNMAIREIYYMEKMKRENFHLEFADTRLLPEDFDKKNSDNMILSVAIKYKDRNPFIVTNDINFQNKAAIFNIPSKGLKEILPAEVFDTIDFGKPGKKTSNPPASVKQKIEPGSEMHPKLYRLIANAYNCCKRVGTDVVLSALVSEIKLLEPRFNSKYYGFEKFKDLCKAYPSIIELYNNNSKTLCIRLQPLKKETENKEIRDSRTFKAKDDKMRTKLDNVRYTLLKQLVQKMISEENPSSPVIDGDIRNEFYDMTKIPIKLNIIKQVREELGIPTAKIRKENYQNSK